MSGVTAHRGAERALASIVIAALALSAMALAGMSTARHVHAADTADVIVLLEGTPAALVRASGGDASAQVDRLRATQDAFLADLSNAGIDATVLTTPFQEGGDSAATSLPLRYFWTLNGLALRVPAGSANAILAMDGVTSVQPVREVQAFLDTSVPYTNAPSVWEDYGYRGEGITVADIDTGIAWDHPEFTTDPTAIPGVNHDKITKYYTFTEGLYDGNGHGTHVGGIIAGDSSLGHDVVNPLTGYGQALLDGVAPKATLFGYKVLSDAGTGLNASVVLAIEVAVIDNADVLNLSLGSSVDAPDSPESVALANAMAAGHFVAVAAGNDGPGYSTIGTPATRQEILTVGSSTDPGNVQYYVEDRDGGERLPINLMSNSPAPSDHPLVDEQYVYVGEGCTPADYGLAAPVMGRVALIARGTCTFSVKKDLAQANGAAAALIFNNVPGNFSGTMSESDIVVGALSDVDGQQLVAQTDAAGLSSDTLLFDPDSDSRVGQISGFSSRGPTDDFRIKPDLVAPGDSITSAVPVVATPVGIGHESGYADAGGTSMASPHMAGAAALMRQANPDWTTEEMKAAFMNTAIQLADPVDGNPYSIMDQGAGLVDVRAAIDTPAVILNPSHSFGEARTGGDTATFTAEFTIVDKSGDGGTWSLEWQDGDGRNRGGEGRTLPAAGWSQSLSPSSVSVPAGGSATFKLAVTMDGSVLAEGDYEGRIVATGDGVTLRVPVFAHHDTTPPSVQRDSPTLDDPGDTNTTGTYDLAWSDVAGESAYRVQQSSDFATAFSDDAEGGMEGRWVTEGAPMGWMSSTLRSNSPDTSYGSLNVDEKTSTLTLATPISVPAGSDATISFASFEDTEPAFDFGYVEASNDGGSTWETLLTINGWSEGEWLQRAATAAGLTGDVLFRFRYVTDQLVSAPLYEGWYVDDIVIGVGAWSSIGQTGADATSFTVTDQANGTFYHRVAGLFDTGSSELAPGPYSNVVDITVEQPMPNLVVADMSASEGPNRRTVTLSATVANEGSGAASASGTSFTLDDGTLVGTADTPALGAGETATVSVTWDTRGLNGTVIVTATADADTAVSESDEGDNTRELTVEVRGNKVRNQSFEDPNADASGPDAWTASSTDAGTAEWSEGGSDGEMAVSFSGTGGAVVLAGSPTWSSEPIAVTPGDTLTLDASVAVDGASSAPVVSLAYLGAAGDLLDTVTVLTAPHATDGFESLEATVTVPEGVAQVRVVLSGFAATDLATSGTVTFDDIGLFGG